MDCIERDLRSLWMINWMSVTRGEVNGESLYGNPNSGRVLAPIVIHLKVSWVNKNVDNLVSEHFSQIFSLVLLWSFKIIVLGILWKQIHLVLMKLDHWHPNLQHVNGYFLSVISSETIIIIIIIIIIVLLSPFEA